MDITFLGAARTVTGSKHLLRTARGTRILLDCGLFQGHRRESIARNEALGVEPSSLDAVVLSHAHMDHSGALPILVKRGYVGPVYATSATRDLCAAMLVDAAFLQAADARYVNNRIARDGVAMAKVQPLFDEDDVLRLLQQVTSLPYHRRERIAPDVHLTFLDAGHVLGSAIVVLDVEEEGETKRLVFTGDLGRKGLPILRDPEVASGAHALLTESTYGDRVHPPYGEMEEALAAIVHRVHARGGKLVIPSFALERAQEILYALNRLRASHRLPRMPVYVDSPLTIKVTDVFRLHLECFDAEARALVRGDTSPFDFPELRYVSSVEESMAIDAATGPSIVIAGSGMCEGGRVLHHLRRIVEDERCCVAIVGFQAEHTLGRRIAERSQHVRIFGVERPLRAEVEVLSGFSAHAGRDDLLEYAEATRERGKLRDVLLVHGEYAAQRALADGLAERGFPRVHIPASGESLSL